MAEQWRPIPGFEGYEASDYGRVRSYWRQEKGRPHGDQWVLADYPQRILSTNGRLSRVGYPCLSIRGKIYPVHRLVLLAFIGPLPDGMETRHLDGNPENNHLSNLCYGTPSENSEDMYRHGYKGPRKLDTTQVNNIRKLAAMGFTAPTLARAHSVSKQTISRICRGLIYTDCPGPIVERMTPKKRKLSLQQREDIKERYLAGSISLSTLAREYGVDPSYISKIKDGIR